MTKILRPLAATSLAAILAAAGTPAHAQQRDVAIDVERTAQSFGDWLKMAYAQLGLSMLRLVSDVRYEALEVAPGSGGLLITGLTVSLPLPDRAPRACTVTAGQVEYTTSPLAILTGFLGTTTIDLTEVEVPVSCLPEGGDRFAGMAGLDRIVVDDLNIALTYDVPSAEAEVSLRASLRDVADIEAKGVLDYAFFRFPQLGPNPDGTDPEPVPVIEFGNVDLSIRDRGLTERMEPFLQMAGLDRAAVPGMAAGALTAVVGLPDLGTAMQRELERFLTDGGRLILAARPGELWLDEVKTLTPPEIVRAFNVTVGEATRPDLPSGDLLAAFESDDPSREQRLAIARASLAGEGFPRNPSLAIAMLGTLVEDDAKAQALAAEAILQRRKNDESLVRAYELAIEAGAGGEPVGRTLRTIEARLPAAIMQRTQNAALAAWGTRTGLADRVSAGVASGDTAMLMDLARSFETGAGAPRHWGAAYTYALLAEAAGEIGADRIVRNIERLTTGDEADAVVWSPALDAARDRATELWTLGGLAAALAGRRAPVAGAAADGAVDERRSTEAE